MSKSLDTAKDIAALIRARNALLLVVTREEARVESYLFNAAASVGYVPYTWDVAAGACDMAGKPIDRYQGSQDPGAMLASIQTRTDGTERGLWIMRDLPIWLQGPAGAAPCRQLRNLVRLLSGPCQAPQTIVVITPSNDIPAELAGHATVIEWALPDRSEIADMLDIMIQQYDLGDMIKNGMREQAIDAAVGLSGEEAKACYSKSLVQLRRIDPAIVSKEKKRIIAREKVLEWIDPLPLGLDSVGGLDNLKTWLLARANAYSPAARSYGLPLPKGALLVGVPGCGKSLTAKAIATAWGVPLLRLDMGSLKSKFVGESEGNLRKALRVIEAIGRCVVWVDEIEKAMQGATSGSADGGVSADALGTVLTWLNDQQSGAFVVATANDVTALPPELLRKGRFDEIWFVDMPNATERVGVLQAAMRSHGRNAEIKPEAMAQVVQATDGFSGAEIAALVPDALYSAFADNAREIDLADLLTAAKTVVPLSRTASEKITTIRNWAKGRARYATAQVETAEPRLRVLDI